MDVQAYRGEVLHFTDNPATTSNAHEYFADGLLVLESGKIKQVGDARDLLPQYSNIPITEHKNSLILPGFVDTHTHYSQLDIIASPGKQLLQWLQDYTYPAETKFSDYDYAYAAAHFFLNQLLKNGSTSACIFPTVHSTSVDALFTAAKELNMRVTCGKVLMDTDVPDELTELPEQAYDASAVLIEQWHGVGRLSYAISPRYALACSDKLLQQTSKLYQQYPDVMLHTHLAENQAEVQAVQQQFPNCKNYLDVYDHYQLLGENTLFAHGIHLQEEDFKRLAETGSSLAFCPSANLFLGSGLFDLNQCLEHQIEVGLATDVGAGSSLSLLQIASEAYKVQQLQDYYLDPLQTFYQLTLGGARAIKQSKHIGNFEAGKEADFIVLDLAANELLQRRLSQVNSLDEKLFSLIMLAGDKAVKQSYVHGGSL